MAWVTVPTIAAGTDLPNRYVAGESHAARRRIVATGGVLGPCDDVAAGTDEGEALTGAAAATQFQIPTWWGRGQGNWVALDVDRVDVIISDQNDVLYTCAQFSNVHWWVTQAAGNLTFQFRNDGSAAAGAGAGPLRITFVYWQTFDW